MKKNHFPMGEVPTGFLQVKPMVFLCYPMVYLSFSQWFPLSFLVPHQDPMAFFAQVFLLVRWALCRCQGQLRVEWTELSLGAEESWYIYRYGGFLSQWVNDG